MSCLVLLVFVLIVTVPFCFPVIVSSGDLLSFFLSVSSFLLEIDLVLLVLLFSSASLWFRGGVCLVLFVLVLLLLFLSVFLLLFLSCFHWAWGYVLFLSAPHIFR